MLLTAILVADGFVLLCLIFWVLSYGFLGSIYMLSAIVVVVEFVLLFLVFWVLQCGSLGMCSCY